VLGSDLFARVFPQGACAVRGVAGPWDCVASSVSKNVVAVVGPQTAAFAMYQAQVRKPRRPARVHPRENGVVQAVVGTCAQAAGLSSAHLDVEAVALLHGSQCYGS